MYVVQRSPGNKDVWTLVGQAVGKLVSVGAKVRHGPTIVRVPLFPERVVKRDPKVP